MALLVLTSAAGSPGVTTLSVGLALTWPRAVLLADCDPAAPQAVLAGYLRGQSRTGKGLLRVAEAHRDRRALAEVVIDQTVELAADEQHRRLLLPGFSRPGGAGLFAQVWADLAEAFVRLEDVGIDVVVDAGRMPAQGLPVPLVERAHGIGLVTRASLRALAAARMHAPTLIEQCRQVGGDATAGVVLVGEGKPYSGREVSSLLGLPVLSAIADDPAHAACLSDGATRPRKFARGAFARSLEHAASDLSSALSRTSLRVGSGS